MKRVVFSLLFVVVATLLVAPDFENGSGLQGSLPPKSDSVTVRRAMVKSILWASDEQIRGLVRRAETKYGGYIHQLSKKYRVRPDDIKAIAIVESLIAEQAASGEGAVGLMGIKKGTGKDMGFANIEHPYNNLTAGTKYYRGLLKRFQDRELALAAYNLGPAELDKRLGGGFDPETINYIWKIRRVLKVMNASVPKPSEPSEKRAGGSGAIRTTAARSVPDPS